MKKLRKNKFVILAVCVILVSVIYLGVQKAIDNYAFATNSDIVTEDAHSDKESEGGTAELIGKAVSENLGESEEECSGQILEEETNLVLEEIDSSGSDTESKSGSKDNTERNKQEVDNSEGQKDNETSVEVEKIFVYVTGEVNNPGVVILNEGSRIVDAINAAGGTTIKANVSKVNLVYILTDGMKVNIPNDKDLKNNPDYEYITMNSGDGRKDDYSNSYGDNLSRGDSSTMNSSSSKDYDLVNINTATQTELETLPGIGPSLALKIINYRRENGKFSSINEIKNVSGIGESKFENIRSYIKV